jgi:hypothetical protein
MEQAVWGRKEKYPTANKEYPISKEVGGMTVFGFLTGIRSYGRCFSYSFFGWIFLVGHWIFSQTETPHAPVIGSGVGMMVGFPMPGYLRRRRMSASPPSPSRAVVVGSGTGGCIYLEFGEHCVAVGVGERFHAKSRDCTDGRRRRDGVNRVCIAPCSGIVVGKVNRAVTNGL